MKIFFWALLTAGVVSTVLAIVTWSAKWCVTAGLIFDIAGIVQFEISGLFTKIFDYWAQKYGDEKKYPSGPPSHITRQLIEMADPDQPVRTWFKNTFYCGHYAGFWLLVAGFAFQLMANWL
jgi:hypothetical protein